MKTPLLFVCLSAWGIAPVSGEDNWRAAIERSMKVELEGKYIEARQILAGALEAARLHPEDSERAGVVLMRLGWVCFVLGEYDEAGMRYRAAIAQLEKSSGKTQPALLAALAGYASLCESRRDLGEAERIRLRLLDMLERERGAAHPDTLAVRADLARGHFQRGEAAQAESAFREILASWPVEEGPRDARRGQAWSGLGYVLFDMNKMREAREAFERSLSITLGAAGPRHPVHLDARYGLALALMAEKRWREAEQNLREAEALAESGLGGTHPLLPRIIETRARVLKSLGLKAEAREMERSARMLRRRSGAGHSSVSFADLGGTGKKTK